MKRSLILVAVLLAACTPSSADLEANIRGDFEKLTAASLAGDVDAIVDYTYPGLIVQVGGRDAMRTMVADGLAELAKKGLALSSDEIISVSETVQAGPELHAVVRSTRTLKGRTGRQVRETFVIAVSGDKGQHWTFVDGPQLTPRHVMVLFPEFNTDLVLPRVGPPVFKRDTD